MPPEEGNQVASTEDDSSLASTPTTRRMLTRTERVIPGVLFYVLAGLLAALFSEKARTILLTWWWAVAIAILAIAALFFVPTVRRRLLVATARTRVGLLIFVVIPILSVLVGAVVLLPEEYQIPALRTVFLLVVCLFPAVMYYLFIASRKDSLLNEFLSNLDRLRLIEGDVKSASYRRRVLTYLQKFQAVYGPLPEDLANNVLRGADLKSVSADTSEELRDAWLLPTVFTPQTAVPVVLATVLIALGWVITLPPLGYAGGSPTSTSLWQEALNPEKTPVHFAFLGAYFFLLQMLFRRYVRRDLRASSYTAVSLRIIVAVIGVWAALSAVEILPWTGLEEGIENSLQEGAQNSLLVLGFVIGAFPPVAWQFVRAALKKFTGATILVPSLQNPCPVSDLDGLTVWHQARLEEEDIENVPNMATADIVELMLNTRFPPDRIIDWVDQAILYTHLGSVRKGELGSHFGIRNASSLIQAYSEADNDQDRKAFEKIVPGIRSLISALGGNPNLKLIRRWRGLDAAE